MRRARARRKGGGSAAGAPQSFELARFLPYLINRAGARLAVAFGQEIAPQGVVLQEWRVLAALTANGPQRLGDLAELTSIDVSTLSRLIGRMARNRLVARTRESDDRRAVRLELSPKGRDVVDSIIPLAHIYERTALAGFGADEAEQLRAMLRRVYLNLGALPR
jgi:MarR family transcriptional regulator, organic hydroperoxide resistance regulator